MSYHKTVDPWQEAANNVQGIEGAHLRCSGKTGEWTLDGAAIDTGRSGLMIAVIMPTALHGRIRFDGEAVTRKPVRYEDAAPDPDGTIEKPWGPLTEVLCVGMDQAHAGQLMTFTGASWGARKGFSKLIKPYLRKSKQAFPVCELGTKERHDVNNNIDPVLTPVDWAPRDRFPDLLPPETPRLPEPERRPLLTAAGEDDAYHRGVDPDLVERF